MRRQIREDFECREFSDVDEFLRKFRFTDASCGIKVKATFPLLFRWINRGKDVTVVAFSAAITSRVAHYVPVFSGWNLVKELDANVLLVSDPTLMMDDRITLGWYAGNRDQPLLVGAYDRIFERLSLRSRVLFFGASGGGFASLRHARMLEDSLAVVSNPQTDITKFSYYPTYLDLAWGIEFEENLSMPIVTNLNSLYSEQSFARVIYVQNSADIDHVKNHYDPFRRATAGSESVMFLTPSLGNGHVGPDVRSFQDLLSIAVSDDDWSKKTKRASELDLYSRITRNQ